MLHGGAMTQSEMEATLREEINGAVFEYSPFCKEFFEIKDQDRRATIMKSLAQEPLFNHQRQPWTIDCTGLKGNEDNQACETMATILDIISKAAFMKDQFRPVHSTIRPFNKWMDADDLDDTNTQPDIIQAPIYLEDRSHWAEVEFFAECKADPEKQGETNLNKLKRALMQLARYARATLVHQIYRLHVFAIAVCGTKATFVRLGRSGILHSPLIDLSTNFETFALAAAGLFALEPLKFGYNTDFYFWPELTREPNERRMDSNEDGRPKELRIKAGNRIWRVAEALCQRKCLVGCATLVLLLSRVKTKKQRVVLKLIWRDKLRDDEADNLKHFEEYFGISKCKWRKVCDRVSTSVEEENQAKPLSTASYFFPPLSEAEFRSSRSNSTNVSLGTKAHSDATKQAVTEKGCKQDFPPQDRELGVILMNEGVGLVRITQLPHLLRVLRDGLVGLAGISLQDKIHRDISEGNILCAPLVDSNVEDTESWSENESTLLDSDEDEDKTLIEDDPDVMFNELDLLPENGVINAPTLKDYVKQRYGAESPSKLPLTPEKGEIDKPMYDVNQLPGAVRRLGELYDLEFMVNQNQNESCGLTRTGTPAFISGQLLLAMNDEPVPHTYLHDLESFFWVLVWMLITHVEPGKKMNKKAEKLLLNLCVINDRALGNFKGNFIGHPSTAMEDISKLENGWNLEPVCDLIYFFADLLREANYTKANMKPERSTGPSSIVAVLPKDEEKQQDPWPCIKSFIDLFDFAISELPTP